jgi:1-deoxy-D-xylulose-5-phosphate synthase
LLSLIDNPAAIKGLNLDELASLCEEMRGVMIRVVSQNGGHLASSLGAVELIAALHYVFDAPRDKLIFDVGHQAYAHKLLTGRAAGFATLRQEGGLSGFLRREESPYDAVNSGHSSVSISAALGLASARDLSGQKHSVVAVIGDGALTGGMALEAVNHAGGLQKNLLVVYNDNRMSISPNVGALSQYLSLKLTTREHIVLRERVKNILERISPSKGSRLIRRFQRAEESLKGFLVSPDAFLAAWGFKYIGPIDGHDLKKLISALNQVKNITRPVLLHVLTTKGKGFTPAEKDPLAFHGLGRGKTPPTLSLPPAPAPASSAPASPAPEPPGAATASVSVSGAPPAAAPASVTIPSYTDVFGEFMTEAAGADEKIAAVTAAMSQGTGLEKFFSRFPERAFDVGIAEQHAVTFAAGLALGGLKPVVAVYSTFLQRSFDQLFHDVALPRIKVVLAVDRAGLVGEDGPTHHGGLDLGYLRMLPNFTVMAPKDEHELKDMLRLCLGLPGPSAVRYPRGPGTGRPRADGPRLEAGRAEIMRRGKELAVLALGSTVWPAWEAAEKLSRAGRDVMVVNMRFVKPLDREVVALAARTGKILTVEENSLAGGLHGAVCEAACAMGSDAPLKIKGLGLTDAQVGHAGQGRQRALLGLDAAGVERAALEMLA